MSERLTMPTFCPSFSPLFVRFQLARSKARSERSEQVPSNNARLTTPLVSFGCCVADYELLLSVLRYPHRRHRLDLSPLVINGLHPNKINAHAYLRPIVIDASPEKPLHP